MQMLQMAQDIHLTFQQMAVELTQQMHTLQLHRLETMLELQI